MLSLLACLLVTLCVALLLTGRFTPIIIFTLIPVIVSLLGGFSCSEIESFVRAGLHKVMPTAVMFIFAILYFALMQERGLFTPMIDSAVRWAGDRLTSVTIATVLIAIIAHLDGSGSSTFLICIPTLLPLYQRLHMSPLLLLLLISASASVMNMLPWGGPLGRAGSVIHVSSVDLWWALMPIQIGAIPLLLIGAYLLGRREQYRINALPELKHEPQHEPQHKSEHEQLPTPLTRSWWINLILTGCTITILLSGKLPSALVFMIAFSLALLLNRLHRDAQHEFLARHAASALSMGLIILSAGIFLGILTESQMLRALAQDLCALLPELIEPHLHIIIGFLGVPFELILNTDAYYFGLLPVVQEITSVHHVPSESVVYAMLIGNIIGTFVSPFSPALWLALGLTGVEMRDHLRYSLKWIWALSLLLMLIAWGLSLF